MTTILIVEDERENQELFARYLTLVGYQVVVALDGRQAVSMASSASPDLILMDMRLPVLDGWEATRQIKAATRTIPIIALTAHAMREERDRCLAAGCDDYESKPVDFLRLLAKMRALIDRKHET